MKEQQDVNNEITVRLNTTYEEAINYLIENDFYKIDDYYLEDIFFIPRSIKIEDLSVREILNNAIIIRKYINNINNHKEITLTKKIKNINAMGEITNQSSANCRVYDLDSAMIFLKYLDYDELMTVKEYGKTYLKNGLAINIKKVFEGDILAEIEVNENYKTIQDVKNALDELNIPYDKNNYFVKKSEESLERKLNKRRI